MMICAMNNVPQVLSIRRPTIVQSASHHVLLVLVNLTRALLVFKDTRYF